MKMENPWIAAQCRGHDVAPNELPTFLQEQYGQLGEDLILEAALKSHFARLGLSQSAVRYLEVGANHPIQTSNTFLFARRWQGRGVLVEANPRLVDDLRKVRPNDRILNYAVVPKGYPSHVTLSVATNSELSSLDIQHVRSFGSIGTIEGTVQVEAVTIDELLEHCFPEGLHVLSIDIEGLDLEVLRGANFVRRPVFVIAEPSRHYHADIEQSFLEAMSAHGYVEVARTDYNLIFQDASQTAVAAPVRDPLKAVRVVRTFDVFDTLIARHCIRAEPLFRQLEQRAGVPGLARARYEAEREVESDDYTFTDIYTALARKLGLEPSRAEALMQLELQLELENVVPIRDNLALVDADSVLITDMYLPVEVISVLLRQAGLDIDLPIVRTSHGKRHGQVWKTFSDLGVRCVHLGDNPASDVKSAADHGMRATLSSIASPTPVEMHLYGNGFPVLAQSLRSARLKTASAGLPDWLYRLQTQLNLPFLVVCAVLLMEHLRSNSDQRAVFASRDGRHLKGIFDNLRAAAGLVEPASDYWYTSRLARTGGHPEYLGYCRRILGGRPLIIDLCGTGASLAKLFELLGWQDESPPVFFCEFVADAAQEAALRQAYQIEHGVPLKVSSLLTTRTFVGNEILELLNASAEGMVRGVIEAARAFVPLRDELEFDESLANLVRAQSDFIGEFGRHLKATATAELFDEITGQSPQALAALHDAAAMVQPDISTLLQTFLPAHRANEAVITRELYASCR